MQHIAAKRLLVAVAASGAFAAAAGGVAHADSGAEGVAADSPGVGGGNAAEAPVGVPVNLCGNGLHVVGLLSPALGGVACANAAPAEAPPTTPPPTTPPTLPPPEVPESPVPTPPAISHVSPPVTRIAPPSPAPVPQADRLAETGSETSALAVAGIAFVIGGTILYRRARPTAAV